MRFRTKLAFITVVYWVLLVYILAALVWWFIALQQQNRQMAELRLSLVSKDHPAYESLRDDALDFERRKYGQYIGEGAIFMLLIVVGAVFVYRATRRQLRLGQQQQNFMMAITHELKTPIAATRLNVETLLKRKTLDEGQQEILLQRTLDETNRLNDLASNILLASRLESDERNYSKEPIDLGKLVTNMVEQFEARFAKTSFDLNAEPDTMVAGDAFLLNMLVSNLLENAVKYAPVSTVEISVKAQGEFVHLMVGDNGPGIPDDEKKAVFKKFYRVGNEATRIAKGTGLGLYLCRRIAQVNGGTIQLEDNKPAGALFTLVLPALQHEY